MYDPITLRKQAQKCCALLKTASEPNVVEQLRMWSVELAGEADALDRRAAEISNLTRLQERHRLIPERES